MACLSVLYQPEVGLLCAEKMSGGPVVGSAP